MDHVLCNKLQTDRGSRERPGSPGSQRRRFTSPPPRWGGQGLYPGPHPACKVAAVCFRTHRLSYFGLDKGNKQDQQGVTTRTQPPRLERLLLVGQCPGRLRHPLGSYRPCKATRHTEATSI
ncbi:hypothetical protein PAL_GLEAN10009446 [Pteropus alecto]|uniref:Uncharacterized protein n=1 Tax=Pteropus alecto TaxID=9402 RepID=L5L3C3_PTEAL|nr:hypothetical protein PAL_GLEAN10009446 [Pteropus alecto]